MIAKVFIAAFALLTPTVTCLSADSQLGDTFYTLNEKLSKLADDDCDGRWRLLWQNRHNKGAYAYLALSSFAAYGLHAWQPASELQNEELSLRFAALSFLNGENFSLHFLEILPEGYKQDSLSFAIVASMANVIKTTSDINSKYYNKKFTMCAKDLLSGASDDFEPCFNEFLKETDNSDFSENSIKPRNAHIECPPKPNGYVPFQ